MESIEYLISTPHTWYALSLCALLLFAFRADSAATGLGLTVVDPGQDSASTGFSFRVMLPFAAIFASILVVLYVLKRAEFLLTLATLFAICSYIWLTGYRTKIRLLRAAGLSSGNTVVLVSLYTAFTASLFAALAMSAWARHGAP